MLVRAIHKAAGMLCI